MASHSSLPKIKCPKCEQAFPRAVEQKQHQVHIHGNRVCAMCLTKFRYPELHAQHVRRAHKDLLECTMAATDGNEKWSCRFCAVRGLSIAQLMEHEEGHGAKERWTVPKSDYDCKICEARFTGHMLLTQHHVLEHGIAELSIGGNSRATTAVPEQRKPPVVAVAKAKPLPTSTSHVAPKGKSIVATNRQQQPPPPPPVLRPQVQQQQPAPQQRKPVVAAPVAQTKVQRAKKGMPTQAPTSPPRRTRRATPFRTVASKQHVHQQPPQQQQPPRKPVVTVAKPTARGPPPKLTQLPAMDVMEMEAEQPPSAKRAAPPPVAQKRGASDTTPPPSTPTAAAPSNGRGAASNTTNAVPPSFDRPVKAESESPEFQCSDCEAVFTSQAAIMSHKCGDYMPPTKKAKVAQQPQMMFKCTICLANFDVEARFVQHMQANHQQQPRAQPPQQQQPRAPTHPPQRQQLTSSRQLFPCGLCKSGAATFSSEDLLGVHKMNIHNLDNPYECTTCPRSYQSLRHLTIHRISCKPAVDADSDSDIEVLDVHLSTKKRVPPIQGMSNFKCEECHAFSGRTRGELITHLMKYHNKSSAEAEKMAPMPTTNVKLYMCNKRSCKAQYRSVREVQLHMQHGHLDRKGKTYNCKGCRKVYVTMQRFIEHRC